MFLNACIRPCSRTFELAQTLLKRLEGNLQEVCLHNMPLAALDLEGMEKRDEATEKNDFSDPSFDAARQFADADIIVIAAPYWDLMFPSVLKTYLENITVCGLTFRYSDQGRPESLCKAKALYYVTTSGGYIGQNDFGFSYIKALAQNFFEIPEVKCYTAQGLDIFGADADMIMEKAKQEIIAACPKDI